MLSECASEASAEPAEDERQQLQTAFMLDISLKLIRTANHRQKKAESNQAGWLLRLNETPLQAKGN